MDAKKITVLTHGGAGSRNEYSDGTVKAAQKLIESVKAGTPLTTATCHAVAALEDDSRFNAGMGSAPRSDGSVEMDAAFMDSAGNFGAVAALGGFKNPIYIAEAVARSKYRVLAGEGAAGFAASGKFQTVSAEEMRTGKGEDFSGASDKDTVGCVAWDGETFATGLSTGGVRGSLPGRVGDVPLIGCGLYAGPEGAVAATGDGEAILMNMTAIRAYQMIEKDVPADDIVKEVLSWFEKDVAAGIILVSGSGFSGGSNRTMAWSVLETQA